MRIFTQELIRWKNLILLCVVKRKDNIFSFPFDITSKMFSERFLFMYFYFIYLIRIFTKALIRWKTLFQEITLWRKGEKSRKSQTASPHLPSHLVSAETGFPQGAAQNALTSQPPDEAPEETEPSDAVVATEGAPAPIEGMTREEGDGEGERDVNPENNWSIDSTFLL